MSIASISIIESVRELLGKTEGATVHYDPPTIGKANGVFWPTDSLELTAAVRDFAAARFPDGLFRHQHLAISQVLAGENTVVATKTSSGKSLIYSLPVLDAMCRDDEATALFIYPQKALANDQLLRLQEAVSTIPALQKQAESNPHLCCRYDGATAKDLRPAIRKSSRVVITNPDMLHFAMLQYHDKHWARFFSNLKYVVIDECHEYRGIFGTNVAFILRRLRQICELHSSSPVSIATSATIKDPQQHMEHLTGQEFSCVGPESDGSRQGKRKYWMVSGDEHFYDFGRKLSLKLADEGLTVLAFCPGRLAAERMMAKVLSARDEEMPHVKVYRAGLSASEREKIEDGLRDKSVRLVFSTSALELGIDIGAVDVVVCIGLPGSMMSLWQRAGRAGRAGKEGAVILIPGESPIDTYYAEHPQELFGKDNESLILNTSNRRVVCQHFACATAEAGGDEESVDTEILGEEAEAVRQLRAVGQMDLDIFYASEPHMRVNIRSIGDGCYLLEHAGVEIGEIDEFHLLREAYRNAIYRHGGCGYRVRDIIRGRKKVILEREYSWNETTPYIQKKIRLKRRYGIANYREAMVATVAIDVTEFLLSVVEKDRAGKTVRQWNGNAGMPSHPLPTEGTMLLLRPALWSRVLNRLGPADAKAALQSCERLLCSLFPTITGSCDRQDFSSASEITADGQAAIYLYDMVYDGVDLTTAAFDRMQDLVSHASERLSQCECDSDDGCFKCIANPHYPEPSSKVGTAILLTAIQEMLSEDPVSITQPPDGTRIEPVEAVDAPCSACGDSTNRGDRFCRNCGQKLEA